MTANAASCASLIPAPPGRHLGISGKITGSELLNARVSEKGLQSIKAMGKVSPLRGNG